ncbi:MAG TPA: serine O-acetyltransferase, partial [Bacillota bacterium]
TLGNNVLVGVGAKVLGAIVIGDNSRIGAGAVVVKDVPPNCTVVGIPGRVVVRDGRRVDPLDHADLPDPVHEALTALREQVHALTAQVAALRERERGEADACAR